MDVSRGKVELRPYSDSDLAALKVLLTDNSIKQNYMIPDYTPSQLEAAAERFFSASRGDAHFERGIYLDGRLIGFVNDVEICGGDVEIGYAISPAEKGRGYATAALTATLRALFARGFCSVTAGAFEDNRASLRVMEKCGLAPIAREETIVYRGRMRRVVYRRICADNGENK